MKDLTKKGILAGKILDSMSEETADILLEQVSEIKPSRINYSKNKKDKKTKQRFKDDDWN